MIKFILRIVERLNEASNGVPVVVPPGQHEAHLTNEGFLSLVWSSADGTPISVTIPASRLVSHLEKGSIVLVDSSYLHRKKMNIDNGDAKTGGV